MAGIGYRWLAEIEHNFGTPENAAEAQSDYDAFTKRSQTWTKAAFDALNQSMFENY